MALFKFKSKSSVLGLDIGSKVTKIAQLSFSSAGKPALNRCELIETGTLDPDFDSKMKSYIKSAKISDSMVAVSLEDPSMKIRKMEIPKMPDADLIEAIKWNFRDAVEGDIEGYVVSFSKISETAEGDGVKYELIGYAVKRDAVENLQLKVAAIGLQAFFIEPAVVTLASMLERSVGEDSGYVSGVHIGYSETLFYVIGKGVFVFSRPLIGINLEAQEKEPKTFNQKLAIEIQKSIDTFKVNFKMQDITQLYLSGGGVFLPDIQEYLSTNMGLKTERLNPFVKLDNTDTFQGVRPELFVQAIGLAYLTP